MEKVMFQKLIGKVQLYKKKIDGSLIKLWYDNNDWHISTNGTINAYEAEVNKA